MHVIVKNGEKYRKRTSWELRGYKLMGMEFWWVSTGLTCAFGLVEWLVARAYWNQWQIVIVVGCWYENCWWNHKKGDLVYVSSVKADMRIKKSRPAKKKSYFHISHSLKSLFQNGFAKLKTIKSHARKINQTANLNNIFHCECLTNMPIYQNNSFEKAIQ